MACGGSSPNLTAGGGNSTDFLDCYNIAAASGDTITIPAGTYTWATTLTLNGSKSVTFKASGAPTGSGRGSNNTVTINDGTGLNDLIHVTESTAGPTRFTGFTIKQTVDVGDNHATYAFFRITQAASGRPFILDRNTILYNYMLPKKTIYLSSLRALIYKNVFDASISDTRAITETWTHIGCHGSADTMANSWTTVDTYGTRDLTGESNVYAEDNLFKQSMHSFDVGDNCRIVIRYNTFDTSNIGSHGLETGFAGARHAEVYRNTWSFREQGDCGNPFETLLVGGAIFMRGGSWLIHDNSIPDYRPCNGIWGNIAEIAFIIQNLTRSDVTYNPCWEAGYPVPHQVGQGYNGTTTFTDPIYLWNNNMVALTSQGDGSPSQLYGPLGHAPFYPTGASTPPCPNPPADLTGYVAISPTAPANVVYCADASCAKPGYSEYAYPHPLSVTGTSDPPTPGVGASSRQMIRIRRRHWGM